MKLWQKSYDVDKKIERFTIGKDSEMDMLMAPFDVIGSLAHTKMLASIHLLTSEELDAVHKELKNIYKEVKEGSFKIGEGVEDVHSQVELLLIQRIGEAGKKIHSGRSRNDQVLVDLKLYMRDEIQQVVNKTQEVFDLLLKQSEKYKAYLFPGYTHLQVAMPSSFGLWFGAYAESLVDDMEVMQAAYKVVNRNPLGSAAGYGSSFPLDRQMTTDLLGFERMNYNVVYAQMGRGKAERITASAIANIASTLSRMSMDVCLYNSQNFGFISFPDELTTGSSIMPHKKNPDVFELIRGKCNKLQALPNEIAMITTNLPSGYHRELQLIKENFFPAFDTIKSCLDLAGFMLSQVKVKENILDDKKYKFVFSVELVNKLVLEGMPFRDAYKIVGEQISSGEYNPSPSINHTHEGSIGNLMTNEIAHAMQDVINGFGFDKKDVAMNQLLA